MSILKLAEDLKDVPDHFLVSEVRQPTGSYPGYLVVAELERRKGMRDRYLKEAPKSTVVDDLSQPSREQMMSAVAQMQQPGAAPQLPSYQQQPLPPQMPPQMPLPPQIPQMPPAGLMATPQASSLAATDAMASPRKRMAGGGLVAFQEGGDVKRFAGQDGSYVAGDPSYYDPSPLSFLTNSRDQSIANLAAEKKKREDLEAQARKNALLESASGQVPYPKAITELPPAKDRLAAAEKSIRDQKEFDLNAQKKAPPRPKADIPRDVPAAAVSPQQQTAFPSSPTREDMASVGQKAIEAFDKNTPQRFSETEKEIGRRAENLKDRRKSAQNEALMMAGLGILKSRSPGRWLGEGGEEGMLAYRQNMTNVRAGEDAMTDVRQNLAHQQLMQDLAKQQIAQTEKQRYMDLYGHDITRASQMGSLANVQEQVRQAGQKLPAEITALISGAKRDIEMGKYYGQFGGAAGIRAADIDPRILIRAQEQATMELISQKDKPGYAEKLRELTNQYIANMNQTGIPGVPGQQVPNPIRGYGGPGATLVPQ